jgi:O-antigen ligase
VVLIFTFSRSGLFILGVLAVLAFLLYRLANVGKRAGAKSYPHRRTPRLRLAFELAVILVALTAGLYAVGSQNPYFSRLWRYWTEDKARSRTYLEYIAFEQRFVYLATALNIYQQYPLFGVGLGNYAFYFADMAPNQPYDMQKEVMRQITPGEGRDRLITSKNLYARLIAETGLVGTGFFSVFLLSIVGCILYLWASPTGEQRFWALGGALAMTVLLMVIFSFDSFARPNMWVMLGMITAAANLNDPEPTPDEKVQSD